MLKRAFLVNVEKITFAIARKSKFLSVSFI
jgi:hypothetical protein